MRHPQLTSSWLVVLLFKILVLEFSAGAAAKRKPKCRNRTPTSADTQGQETLLTQTTDQSADILTGFAADIVPACATNRTPLGFGSNTTGDTTNNRITVTNLSELRAALNLTVARTVVVQGTITGDDPTPPWDGICDAYSEQALPGYNHTEFILSTDPWYVGNVSEVAAANGQIDGRDAKQYLAELQKLGNETKPFQKAHILQMKKVRIKVSHGDLTLVGAGDDARLVGVDVLLSQINNVVVRNIWFTPPWDCYTELEEPPSAFNANYGALSVETVTDLWVDGCTFATSTHVITPQKLLPDLWPDGFDGIADMTNKPDRITFSHNIVAYHHKALLWGAADNKLDDVVTHITAYGNHFKNVASRSPLMRSGVFHLFNNLYEGYNNEEPSLANIQFNPGDYFTASGEYQPPFGYHLGIYHKAQVLVAANAFKQTGKFADSPSRVFSFNSVGPDERDAFLCVGEALSPAHPSLFNGNEIDLAATATKWFEFYLGRQPPTSVEGGLVIDCSLFDTSDLPTTILDASQVEAYVLANAGSTKV